MAKITFGASVIINSPVEKVFAYTVDLNNATKWRCVQEIKDLSQTPIAAGTTYTEIHKFRGRLIEVPTIINSFIKNKMWSYQCSSKPYFFEKVYKFEEVEKDTRVTCNGILDIKSIFKYSIPFSILTAISTTMHVKSNLNRLKKNLEIADS